MHISREKFNRICKKKNISLKDLLLKSNVSKTAFYNLLYRDRLLPKSIYKLAKSLDVDPSDFLDEIHPEEIKIREILKLTDEITKEFPETDKDDVRHTLLLLQEKPIERLRRGLIRGRRYNFYGKRN